MDKPTDKPQPVGNHNDFSGRVQVLRLDESGDKIVLLFDQWEGPRPPASFAEAWKRETGARGVMITEGTFEVDNC